MTLIFKKRIIILIYLLYASTFINGLFEFPIDKNSGNLATDSQRELATVLTVRKLQEVIINAEESLEKTKRLEQTISDSNIKVAPGSITFAQYLDGLPTQQAKKYNIIGQRMMKSTLNINHMYCKRLGVNDKDCANYIATLPLPESNLRDECLKIKSEIVDPASGLKPYRRLLPADYKNGIYKLRSNTYGSDLPHPRAISDNFYTGAMDQKSALGKQHLNERSDEGVLDKQHTVSLVQWSQFIEQDIANTVVQMMSIGGPIECCNNIFRAAPPRYRHPSCSALNILHTDSFYKKFDISCMNYVRSSLTINNECNFGPAEQLNQATSFFDLSQLYGINEDYTVSLRTLENGLLKSSEASDFPILTQFNSTCDFTTNNDTCYLAGDIRVNANPYVTIIYTIFLRSHNNIAKELKTLNSHWNDEKLFQTAREINIGIYQKIIYGEWMHIVLGDNIANQINNERFSTNEGNNAGVSNEFATAAIRFYNSMMPGDLFITPVDGLPSFNNDNSIDQLNFSNESNNKIILKLEDVYYKPTDLSKIGVLESIQTAIIKQNAMAMDSSYVDDLTRKLYQIKMTDDQQQLHQFGTDSLALDIIRGRDHGINGYIKYLEKCKNIKINNWNDLQGIIHPHDLTRLQTIYNSVNDIDLILGGISEIPQNGAVVGPTFTCILGEQLSNSRKNDIKFFENNNKLMKTVEKFSAARLICFTADIERLPTNIFYVESAINTKTACLPKFNFNIWKEG